MFSTRSFFIPFLLGNLLLIGAILAAGLLMMFHEINRDTACLIERFQEHLLAAAQGEFQSAFPNIERRQIEQYFRHYSKEPRFRLTVIDSNGQVLGDSEFPAEKMESHRTLERPEVIAAMEGKHGVDIRTSRTTQTAYRYLAAPIFEDKKPVAVVRVAIPLAVFQENRQAVFCGILKSFVLMFAAVMVLSPLLLRWIWHKPLQMLNHENRRIAEGNLEPSAPVNGPPEVVQLSQSLETIRRTISGQFETIARQREGLQTILRHLPDAIFAMNQHAEVIYFNDAAQKLFRIESMPERPLLQGLVRNAAIIEWYLEHLTGTPLSSNIERKEVDIFGRRHFLELEFVEAKSASPEDAARLLIISDLSETVRASKMKTDFVANASHELRTPLAAIRAALDNVSDEVFDDKETLGKIIQIVNRHVSRLDALIEDLLALHGTEDESIPARLEETTVDDQRSWIEELFRRRIDEKNLMFSIVSNCGGESFRVDNKRLGLILQNLIDNAIKFTPSGGQITLDFRREPPFLVIECRDTGSGIALEEQQRVFERFYQSDSSKSGDGRLRGTGLGLAIVKHAAERLKGNISLESRLAQGSVFTVRIPVEGYE